MKRLFTLEFLPIQKSILFIAFAFLCNCPSANAQFILTYGGNGTAASTGNGGPAIDASIHNPSGICYDGKGNLYEVEYSANLIRRIDDSGIIHAFAGNGVSTFGGDGGPATSASFSVPIDIAMDYKGNFYVVDNANQRIRKIDTNGIITTLAGNGSLGYTGDGGLAVDATMLNPDRVCTDVYGNVYFCDAGNNAVRKVDTNGIITTVVGDGTGTAGFYGDGGPATSALLNEPLGVVFDAMGNMYIADGSNYRIRKVNPDGIISTIAGNGSYGSTGDGGPALDATTELPGGVAVDGSCNVYFTDWEAQRVRKIDIRTNIITTVVGNGTAGFSGDGGLADTAEIDGPDNLTFAPPDMTNLYIPDFFNNRIRQVVKLGNDSLGCPDLEISNVSKEEQNYKLYPNPSDGVVNFAQSYIENTTVTVRVFNLIGETMYNDLMDFAGGKSQLDLLNVNPGTYVIELIDSRGKLQTFRTVIERDR